ncbi:unnamed protein product [Closterium sp. Naga37s-1]|nr:unnamed protein product [Closterium sp. Naga37s-1]
MASAKLVAPMVAVCALIAVLLVAAPWHVESAAIASEEGEEGRKQRYHSRHPRHSPPTTTGKKGGHKGAGAGTPATPTPDPVPAPATSGKKGGKKGKNNAGAGGGGSAPVVVSKADQKIQSQLTTAASGVQKAADTLGAKNTYYASLTATVQALTNAGILIDEGQRTLVQGQIANAVSTIDGVSVMLDPVNDKKVLSQLASAKATAEAASKAFKP